MAQDRSRNDEGGMSFQKTLEHATRRSRTTNEIVISDVGFCDADALSLSNVLESADSLESLVLSEIGIEDAGAILLSASIAKCHSLAKIDLSENSITAEGAGSLADAFGRNCAIQSINMSGNLIGDDGAKAFADALRTRRAPCALLGLARTGIRAGAKDLIDAAGMLLWLDLSGNFIDAYDAIRLAEALEANASLKGLDLSRNELAFAETPSSGGASSSSFAGSLAWALETNLCLREVKLDHNLLGMGRGLGPLLGALRFNRSMRSISFRGNLLNDEHAASLAVALRGNRTVERIDLGENLIGADGWESLNQALVANHHLKHVCWSPAHVMRHLRSTGKERELGKVRCAWRKTDALLQLNREGPLVAEVAKTGIFPSRLTAGLSKALIPDALVAVNRIASNQHSDKKAVSAVFTFVSRFPSLFAQRR